MKAATKDRLVAIADEIRSEAFMAGKAKNAQPHFSRIHTLSREACDYYAFGFEVAAPSVAAEVRDSA
jgi:hypothetical protein